MEKMELSDFFEKAKTIKSSAHSILGQHETSKSRVIFIEDTYNKLGSLSLKQDDLFRQSLTCVQHGLFRAAHVMSWAAFIDFLEEIIQLDSFVKIKQVRQKWNIGSLNELREGYPESQIIEAMRDANLITKNQCKAFIGLLNKRNEAAHPSDFLPDLNSTLGYISEILQRLELLKN
jgi:flagellar biosynthesis chaperone FliJ